jgi:hypothetical protein
MSSDRWKKVKAWMKLARYGRLYTGGIPPGLTIFDVWCKKISNLLHGSNK